MHYTIYNIFAIYDIELVFDFYFKLLWSFAIIHIFCTRFYCLMERRNEINIHNDTTTSGQRKKKKKK